MKILFLDVDGVLNSDSTKHRVPHGPPRESVQITHTGLEPECVARLNGLVRRTGVALVLSSTWRLPCECNGRRGCPGGLGGYGEAVRVLREHGVVGVWGGATPDFRGAPVNGVYRPKPRGEEIAAWFRSDSFTWTQHDQPGWEAQGRNSGVTSWVALDDGADMRGLPDPERFVQVDSRFGLTDDDVEKAERILARPLGEEA